MSRGMTIAAMVLLLGQPAFARQDGKTADAETILAAVDRQLNQAKTLILEFEIVNQEAGKPETKLAQTIRVKGSQRLTVFTAPKDMEGTKVLVLAPTQMYVYLPAFGKVRRIATHVVDQGFMGMTFSLEDFFVTRYSDEYSASIVSERPKDMTIALTPKPGTTPRYSRIEMTLLKEGSLPTELRYFDDKGTHVKTESRSDYVREGDVSLPKELKMTDATKEGRWTRMTAKTLKVNQDIPDEFFTKKNLEK